ncbi:hypothetical protein [Nocardia sp. NPDC051981]|uniref:hypothetical protein n=1 Tax=Nocardia sp. NPDC051981 TaxID=3155417 RepID=UPI00341F79AA
MSSGLLLPPECQLCQPLSLLSTHVVAAAAAIAGLAVGCWAPQRTRLLRARARLMRNRLSGF